MRGGVAARQAFVRLEEQGMKYPYPLRDTCEKSGIGVRFVPLGEVTGVICVISIMGA